MTDHPPLWHGMTAGACSAVVARFLTYPPDTVKARIQLQGSGKFPIRYSGTLDAFTKIARLEGISGFYRGYLSIVATVIPANACYFTSYEYSKRITPPGLAGDMLTACMAQTVAGIVFCPIDILKQRVQTQGLEGSSHKLTVPQAAQQIMKSQGIAGFYRGFVTMNALWLPWNCIYLTLYEEAKRRVYYWKKASLSLDHSSSNTGVLTDPPLHEVLPLWAFPMCSSTCAVVASVVTHPIDVVKTRLQVLTASSQNSSGNDSSNNNRLTARHVAKVLFQSEGLKGFTRGMIARVSTIGFGSTISWGTYELIKRKLLTIEAVDRDR
jgi:hypothetical protein